MVLANMGNVIINKIASCTFGVYLFHDNPFIRKKLWIEWIRNQIFYDSKWLILRMILSVIIVYSLGIIIELLRQKFLSKSWFNLYNKIFQGIIKLSKNKN